MIHLTKRVLVWICFSLLTLTLCLALWLISSQTAPRLLGKYLSVAIPPLQLEITEGTLLTGVRVGYFRWKASSVDIEAENVTIDWQASCFLSLSLCIEKTHFGLLQLVFHADDDPTPESSESNTLPHVPAPFPMNIDIGHIDVLRFVTGESIEEINQVSLGAVWKGDTLAINTLSGNYHGADLLTSGHLSMVGSWYLMLTGGVELSQKTLTDFGVDAVFQNKLTLPFQLSGEGFLYTLGFTLNQQFPGEVAGTIDFATDDFPVTLNLLSTDTWKVPPKLAEALFSGESFAAGAMFPRDHFQLDELTLRAKGALKKMSFQVESDLKTPLWPVEHLRFDVGTRPDQKIWIDNADIRMQKGSLVGRGEFALLPRLFGELKLKTKGLDFIDTPLHQQLIIDSDIHISAEMDDAQLDVRLAVNEAVVKYQDIEVKGNAIVLADSKLTDGRWEISADTEAKVKGYPALKLGADLVIQNNSLDFSVFEMAFIDASKKTVKGAQTLVGRHIADTGMGLVKGGGAIRFAEQIAWKVNLDLSRFVIPNGFIAQLAKTELPVSSGAIDGSFSLDGNADKSSVIIQKFSTLLLDPQGKRISPHPLTLDATLSINKADAIEFSYLNAGLGGSKVKAKGGVYLGPVKKQKPLVFELQQLDLAPWLPGGSGMISGKGVLSGVISEADLKFALQADRLRYQDYFAESTAVTIDASNLGKGNIEVSLSSGNILLKEKKIAALALSVAGSRQEHDITASVNINKDADVSVACRAAESAQLWSGECSQLDIRHTKSTWSLSTPAAYSVGLAAPATVDVAPFCLSDATLASSKKLVQAGEVASLCIEAPLHFSDEGYRGQLALSHFPINWLQRYWPSIPTSEGTFNSILKVSGVTGKKFTASLDVNSKEIKFSGLLANQDKTDHQLVIHDIVASSTVFGDKAKVSASLGLGEDGVFDVNLNLTDLMKRKSVSGIVSLNGIDLSMLDGLLPDIDGIGGALEASLGVEGTLAEPRISGAWALREGLIDTVQLPEPITAINLIGKLNQTNMSFAGDFLTAGGNSSVDGILDWKERWNLESRLHSKKVTIIPSRGVRLDFQPDLQLNVSEGQISVSGNVLIPSGDIEIIELPANAKSTSPDVVIVSEGKRSESAWNVDADIQVKLGDKVHFKGAGVQTYIDGGVHIQQKKNILSSDGQLISRAGAFSFLGQKLEIREGRLIFNGAIENPDIYVEAIRTIEDENIIVGVRLTGKASAPKLEVFSDPPQEETNTLHYIMTGRKPAPGSTYGAGIAGNLLLNKVGGGTNWLSEKVVGRLGVTDFQISTQSEQEGTSVQLSGYLSPDLYLQYGVKLFDEVNTLSLRYRLRSNLFLEAMTGLDSSLDVIYSFEIK